MSTAKELRKLHESRKHPALIKGANELEAKDREIAQLRQALDKATKKAAGLREALADAFKVDPPKPRVKGKIRA